MHLPWYIESLEACLECEVHVKDLNKQDQRAVDYSHILKNGGSQSGANSYLVSLCS